MKTLILTLVLSLPLIAAPINVRPLNVQKLSSQISILKRELKALKNQLKEIKCFTKKGAGYVLESDFPVTIKAGMGIFLESGSTINIQGALIRFNNGNRRAAGEGDFVNMLPLGATSPILPGTSRVLID